MIILVLQNVKFRRQPGILTICRTQTYRCCRIIRPKIRINVVGFVNENKPDRVVQYYYFLYSIKLLTIGILTRGFN